MLWHALDGWCIPQLADLLEAVCSVDPGTDPGPARRRLLAVGHSSGQALLDGVLHTLATRPTTTPCQGAA